MAVDYVLLEGLIVSIQALSLAAMAVCREQRMLKDGNLYVVDDEAAVLKSVEAVLVQYGLSPICFSSAELFLKEAIQDAPGCIVTDLGMPGMNGLQLQETLIAISSPLSVIFLTGLADVPTTVRIMRNGATTLLVKPYATQELFSAVQNALKSSQVRWEIVCHNVR